VSGVRTSVRIVFVCLCQRFSHTSFSSSSSSPVMFHPPSRTHRHAIWPRQTDPPAAVPSYSKRRRTVYPRQTIADMSSVIQAEEQCQVDSGNEVISCYPTAGVTVAQKQWASFVCMSLLIIPYISFPRLLKTTMRRELP
jgi:hypothetical protein